MKDIRDSVASNERYFGYLCDYVLRRIGSGGGRILIRRARCDGHMWHTAVSLAFERASVSSVLYSSAILLRSGSYKFRMHSRLEAIIRRELDWARGGDPVQDDDEYADQALRFTVMRNFPDYLDVPNEEARCNCEKCKGLCTEVKQLFNCDWRAQRVGHRCRIIAGQWCCKNRSTGTERHVVVVVLQYGDMVVVMVVVVVSG